MGDWASTFEKRSKYFIGIYILSYYALIIFFKDEKELVLLGGNVFEVIAPFVSFVFIIKQFFHLKKEKIRYYWLLTAVATFSYGVGMVIFRYHFTFYPDTHNTNLSDLFWYISIILYIFALVFVQSLTKNISKTVQYIFDIIIVMIVVSSICWHFVIAPILDSAIELGLMYTVVSVSYPIAILVMLFALLSLYYMSQSVLPKNVFIINVIAFSILLFANMAYLHLTLNNVYLTGSYIDPLWPLSMLLFGLASLYNKKEYEVLEQTETEQKRRSGKIIDFLTIKIMLPYLSVITIFIFMIFQGDLAINSLVIGSIASTLLIIIRQILTLVQNSELIFETKELNRELEIKVQQRTKEIIEKNQELEESIRKIEYIAYHDSLTSLTNRRYFEEKVESAIQETYDLNSRFAIMFIDLDRFKFINDTLGHHTGDLLLVSVSNLLKKIVGKDNVVSRQGGDEFMILVNNTTKEEVERLAEQIINELQKPISINGNELFITSSIGISLYPDHGSSLNSLIKRADTSMYSAKEQGKNRYQTFNVSMDDHITLKVNLENGLRKAIELNELSIAYQPKLELLSNEIIGVEALLRWKHSEYGNISPSTFIPLAEETGLILKLGDWVLREACLQLKKWEDEGVENLGVSVNVSTIQFLQKDFVEKVEEILKDTLADPLYLELEITESSTMDTELVISKLKKLKQLGIKISIDDFGSGYSSLSHIKNLPIDILKIDKSFINDIEYDHSNQAIVSTILALATNLNLKTIAEGVENERQYQILKEKGCDQIQGYYISKPVPVAEVSKLLHFKVTNV